MCETNRYDDCIESWKVNLAKARLKELRFAPEEWPDLLQDLIIVMAGFEYRPNGPDAAKQTTALYRIITNRLTSVLRSQQREAGRMERYLRRIALGLSNAHEHPLFLDEGPDLDLQMDVGDLIAQLPPAEQAVCQRLMEGDSITSIASHMNISWRAMDRLLSNIRAKFAGRGLTLWQ